MARDDELGPDDGLAGATAAMHRAARRARVIARQTGTPLIICKEGQIEKLWLSADGDRNVELVDQTKRAPNK